MLSLLGEDDLADVGRREVEKGEQGRPTYTPGG